MFVFNFMKNAWMELMSRQIMIITCYQEYIIKEKSVELPM